MKTRFAPLAVCALFAGNAFAGSFSIYFNGESQTANCHVDNVNSAQLSTSGSGNLVASATTPLQLSTACGVSGSGGQPLTFGPAQPLQGPSSTLASGSNVTGSFTVLPLNAASCTVAIPNPTGCTASIPASGYVCGPSGSQSCSPSPSAPIAFSASFTNTTANSCSYQATVTCQAAAGASPATLTSQTTVSQNGTSGGGGGAYCTTGATGDASGYTAICSGSMLLYKGSALNSNPSGNYTFQFVFGSNWPGSNFGYTEVFTIGKTQFLSIPFTPSPGHTISLVENQTFTQFPITFSISTTMGAFNNGQAGGNVLCVQSANPNLIPSSNGTTSNCPALNPATQYWFNVIPAQYVSGAWATGCRTSTCQLGIAENPVN